MRKLHRVLFLAVVLAWPVESQADSLILKSGELVRGKIVDKDDRTYSVVLDSTEERVEVPVSRVSIADWTASSNGDSPKGKVIFFTQTGQRARPPLEEPKKNEAPVVAAPKPMSVADAYKNPMAILKNAEDTVALANARTAQMEKVVGDMKAIADGANSGSAAVAAEAK